MYKNIQYRASFELIFMKFPCLMRVHPWVNPIVFGNNRANRTTDMGENAPPKWVFWLSFSGMVFFFFLNGKNLWAVFGTPFPTEMVQLFVIRRIRCLKNGHLHKKLFFAVILENTFCFFFFEKIVQWKIFKTSFPTKKGILIFVNGRPSSQNGHVLSSIVFHNFFRKCCVFKTANQHSVSLHLVMPHSVSHLTSPHQATSQHSPGLKVTGMVDQLYCIGGGLFWIVSCKSWGINKFFYL